MQKLFKSLLDENPLDKITSVHIELLSSPDNKKSSPALNQKILPSPPAKKNKTKQKTSYIFISKICIICMTQVSFPSTYIYKHIIISPLLLNNSLAGYGILDLKYFFPKTLKMLFHYLLAYNVAKAKLEVNPLIFSNT